MDDRTPTILCVDDDPGILEVLAEHLTLQGFQVVTAMNGVEALLQVSRCRPKAVILDLFMPRLGGLGALERIQKLDPGIAVILISGVEGAIEMVTEASVSVAGTLKKPFASAQLLELLAQAGVFPEKAPPEGRPPGVPAQARSPGRRRILVVDDDPAIRELLREYLEDKRFEVLEASSGEEALRRVPDFRPHIVLLDIMMPGLSGVEALRRIKALPQETTVVIVSGLEDMETARRTLAMGAADYVTKPIDFAYLDSVLETHLFMDQI